MPIHVICISALVDLVYGTVGDRGHSLRNQ